MTDPLQEIRDEQNINLRVYWCEPSGSKVSFLKYSPDEYTEIRRRVRVHRCRVAPDSGMVSRPIPKDWVKVPVVRFEGETFRLRHSDALGFHLMLPKG